MWRVLGLCLCLMAVPSLEAGSIVFDFDGAPLTFTTTANQDTRLAAFVTRLNAQRAAASPPQSAVTTEQYVQNRCRQTVIDDLQQSTAEDATDACAAYKAASANVRNQIDAALGNKSPCP